ncbi:MAG: TonB-dependent receptor [Bacteroidales bacterium]|nr:TonB-dependent receptor [Bacteroidales bacterium]
MKMRALHWVVFLSLLFSFTKSFSQETDSTITTNLFELSLDDLMNIEIVSAVRKNQNIIDAPSIISVITEKQIRERGYMSVAEALNSIAGVDVITDHYQPNLGIRGINGGLRSWSRLVKVMIDGQNISFRSSSDNYLDASLIPIEAIKRIEIIRGPNSALYGKNAFLGVVNIITKTGTELEKESVSQFYANFNKNSSYGISSIIGGKKDKFDFILASSYSQINKSGLAPKNVPGSSIYGVSDVSNKTESEPLSVFAKLTYNSENLGKFIFDFNHQLIDSYVEFIDWGTLTHNNRLSAFNNYERLLYSNDLSEYFSTVFSISHSSGRPNKKEVLDTDSDPTEWIEREYKYSGYDLSGNLSFNFDEINNLSLGVDFTSDIHDHQKYYTVNNSGLKTLNPGGTNGVRNFDNLGIYLQMIFNAASFFDIEYLKNLTLTAGYRFDYHNIYGDVLTYRLAAVYNIFENLSTKIMYGTSFNAPSSVQLYTNSISPGGIVGNPDLKPERAKTLEWALMGKIIKDVNFSTSLFYTQIDNKIEYLLPYGQISNITAENVSSISSAGIEAELNASMYNNTAYINYSYQKSILNKTDPILENIQINTALYPNQIIKFGDIVHLKKLYSNINIEGKYISSRIASDQNNFVYDPINYSTSRYELDPYFILDLSISSSELEIFKKSTSRICLKVQNLLNTSFYYPGFSNYDIPGLGRTYYVRLTQYF